LIGSEAICGLLLKNVILQERMRQQNYEIETLLIHSRTLAVRLKKRCAQIIKIRIQNGERFRISKLATEESFIFELDIVSARHIGC
jgi:hypothetical protein